MRKPFVLISILPQTLRPHRLQRLRHPTPLTHLRHYSSTRLTLPPNSWDSHVHVIGDPSTFPISSSAVYTPHTALLPDLLATARKLSIPNLVFVQVSAYGLDNSCQLSALQSVTPARARAVVEFDPARIDVETLRKWDVQGVRGVRINLKSINRELSRSQLQTLIRQYAQAVAPVPHWAIDLHVSLSAIPYLEPLIPEFAPRRLIVDHMGSPPVVTRDMSSVPGWSSLIALLKKQENFFVKISAPYRFVDAGVDREFRSFEPLVREMLGTRGGRGVLWASDWPHTRSDGVDIAPWVERCLEWCDGDRGVAERLFRGNAREVWDVRD